MAAEQAPACCGEWRCTRSQPIRVARSELTGMWYAVTAYAERANGGFESMQKHMLHPTDVEQLEAYRLAYQRTLTTVPAEPQDMPAGVEPPTEPEVAAVEAKCRHCGEPLHQGANSLYYGPGGAAVCPQFGSGNPTATHEPERYPSCRWCGTELHLGAGGMFRGPNEKSVCLGDGETPPESYVHEPRRLGG